MATPVSATSSARPVSLSISLSRASALFLPFSRSLSLAVSLTRVTLSLSLGCCEVLCVSPAALRLVSRRHHQMLSTRIKREAYVWMEAVGELVALDSCRVADTRQTLDSSLVADALYFVLSLTVFTCGGACV